MFIPNIVLQSCLSLSIEMKQSKSRPNEKMANKEKDSESGSKCCAKYINDTCIQILAWFLLALGLCIIAIVIYMALRNTPTNYDSGGLSEDTKFVTGMGSEEENDHFNAGFDFSIETFGRSLDTNTSRARCVQKSCRVLCSDNKDVYEDTANVMNESFCGVITSLIISNQSLSCIENKWKTVNLPVLKILLTSSRFHKLKSGAFNSPIFTKVFHMVWMDLEIREMSNGVLLGLYSLRKLEIDTHLPITSVSFLQPVQTTLTHLRLNAGILFNSNSSLLEEVYFEKLLHLDLSHNKFSGSLSKRLFVATPNIMYLHLKYCSLSVIEDDAFQDIAAKLRIINLAHNLFKTISSEVFLPFSNVENIAFFEVEPNNWQCDCQLQSFVEFHSEHASSFMSAPYCRLPYNLFGKTFNELNPDEMNCMAATTTSLNIQSVTSTPISTQFESVNPTTLGLMSVPYEQDSANDSSITSAVPLRPILQFSCSQPIELDNYLRSDYERILDTDGGEGDQLPLYSSGTFVFEPPEYDLTLELFENRSLSASIADYKESAQLNIIWFTERYDGEESSEESSIIDYNCMQYEDPELIINALHENHTYTFCMIPKDEIAISPLNCQPLYVPVLTSTEENTLDISTSDNGKQFTVGMLCLIFISSTVFGAIIAYLGIKAYPDLLEGSKNVLVIKELDKTCYISTISDSEHKKKPININNTYEFSKNSNPFPEPNADISRLNSFQSSLTNFESSFSNTTFQSDEYEMPKVLHFSRNEYTEFNNIETSPNFPPPLPKRNSTNSLYSKRTGT